jgi:hypothetical protein
LTSIIRISKPRASWARTFARHAGACLHFRHGDLSDLGNDVPRPSRGHTDDAAALSDGVSFTIGGTILLAITLLRGEALPRRTSIWMHEAITGVLLVPLANASVVWAEHFISSGLAALLAATLPLWMALLERVLIRSERLTSMRIAALTFLFLQRL